MFINWFTKNGTGEFAKTYHHVNDGTLQATPFGTSREHIGVNLANGNLFISAIDLSFPALGLNNTVKRIYRSQGEGWKVAPTSGVRPLGGGSVAYIHEDGHVSNFVYDAENDNYFCYWPEVGRVSLVKTLEDDWQLSIPPLGILETFSSSTGMLSKRTSWNGGSLNYQYDEQFRLKSVIDSAAGVLSFDYQTQATLVSYNGILQARYVYDNTAQYRLTQYARILENGQEYEVNFAYEGTTSALTRLTQSDGSVLDVTYDNFSVTAIGTPGKQSTIRYENDQSIVTSPEGMFTRWSYDPTTRFLQQHDLFDAQGNSIYHTEYDYDQNAYLLNQREADGTVKHYEYLADTGLLINSTVTASGETSPVEIQILQYNDVGLPTQVNTTIDDVQQIVTLIYANDTSHQLRFTISPTGQVVERQYNGSNSYQCTHQYTYFLTYTGLPTLEALAAWVVTVDPSLIYLETFTYHPNGLVSHKELQTSNNTARLWDYEQDINGRLTLETEPALPTGIRPYTQINNDNLGRVLTTTNTVNRVTSYRYENAEDETPASKITILPSGAIDTKTSTNSGKVGDETIVADNVQARSITNTFNNNDQLTNTTDHLGRITTTLYDNIGRPYGKVDSDGYVTFTHLNHHGLPICAEQLSARLNVTTSQRLQWKARDWRVQLLNLRIHTQNMTSRAWTIYDVLDRPIYNIDPSGAVTEFKYALVSKPVLTIRYSQRILVNDLPVNPSAEQIQSLIQPHIEDRHQRDWYDASGRPIAQLIQQSDTDAFLTEWDHKNQGEVVTRREYATPVTHADKWQVDLSELRPDKQSSDVLTHSYFNLHQELIAEVVDINEEESLLREYKRDVRGDEEEIIEYYTPVARTDEPLPLASIRPQTHTEDWRTQQVFDGMHRVISRTYPNGRVEEFEYVDSSTPIDRVEYDRKLAHETRPEHARGESRKVNSLEETLIQLLPDGVDFRFQYADQEQQAWDIYGRHITLDAVGRKASQRIRLYPDPTRNEEHVIFDYYNARDLRCFHIGAVGEIVEFTYDNRKNLTNERRYTKSLSAEELATLIGGPLTEGARNLFESKRDQSKDRITTYEYDATNKKTIETRPNGQRVLYTYNAFGQNHAMAEEFELNEWRVTFSIFNSMGQKVETIQQVVNGTQESIFSYLNANDSTGIVIKENRVISRSEVNRYGSVVREWNGNGVETLNFYDKRQQLYQKTCQGKRIEEYVRDTHSRIKNQADTRTGYDIFTHNTAFRTITKTSYDEVDIALPYSQTITQDAFEQTIKEDLGDGVSVREIDRNAYGKPISETNGLGEVTSHEYLVGGLLEKSIDPSAQVEVKDYDNAYRSLGHHFQPLPSQLFEAWSISNGLNTFGDTEQVVKSIEADPTAEHAVAVSVLELENNSIGMPVTVIEDPLQLPRTTLLPRRLDNAVIKESIVPDPALRDDPIREVAYENDGFNRKLKTITLAEENITLTTTLGYDAGDTPIQVTDANNDITHIIHGGHGLSTLTINPRGFGVFKESDSAGHIIRERKLLHRFTLDEINALRTQAYTTDLASVLSEGNYFNLNDRLHQKIYDRAGYLRYTVTAGGKVTEYRYNNAGYKNYMVSYATDVTVNTLESFTLASLEALIVNNPETDAITHYILDAEGRPRYIVDAENYLTGQQFDVYGLVHETIRYAEPLSENDNPETLTLSQAQVLAQAREGNAKNQVDLDFHSARTNDEGQHLLRFEVNSAGQVTQIQYDVYGNQIRTVDYIQSDDINVLRTLSYAEMQDWSRLHDNDAGNIVNETRYDTLNRKTADIDALGGADIYSPDLLGNPATHTNKNGDQWRYGNDLAGRQIAQHQPTRKVTHVDFDEETETFTVKEEETSVSTSYVRDGIGRNTQTREAVDQEDERMFSHTFIPSSNKPTSKTLKQVGVYHLELDSNPKEGLPRESFEVIQDLIETSIYDAFERKTVDVLRDGNKIYHVYDADDNEVYSIAPDGAVLGYQCDAWGREISRTEYANKISINHADYPEGLTLADMEGILPAPHSDDRTINTVYDRLGRKIAKILPKAIYVDPETTDANQQFYQYGVRTLGTYGAFNNPTVETKIINPYKVNQPIVYYYYEEDNPNQLRATIDELGYLTEYSYNMQGEWITRIEYATPCITYDQHSYVRPELTEKDRVLRREYDAIGRCVAEQVDFIRYHEQQRDENVSIVPVISDPIAQHRVLRTFFDKQGNPIVVVRYLVSPETNAFVKMINMEVMLYSPIGKMFASLGVAKKGMVLVDGQPQETRVVPITEFLQDSHGRTVSERLFARSSDMVAYEAFEQIVEATIKTGSPHDPTNNQIVVDTAYQLATPLILEELRDDETDRVNLTKFDAADNPIATRESTGLVRHLSFTAVPQQQGKHWVFDERWDSLLGKDHVPTLSRQPWVDRYKHDAAGNQVLHEQWVGEQYHAEHQQFNAFRKRVGRGDELTVSKKTKGSEEVVILPEQWKHNALDQVTATNEGDGVWRRNFYQPIADTPALTVKSATVDLSADAYADARRILNLQATDRRETWVTHDFKGRATEQRSPIYAITQSSPKVAIRVGKQTGDIAEDIGEYALAWLRPDNYGTHARFCLRVYGTEEWIELPVTSTKNGSHMGVDVTTLVTDNYEYTLSFYHNEAEDAEPYAVGNGQVPVITPILVGSLHSVIYVDPNFSTTKILITGNTTDPDAGELTGIRAFKPDEDDAVFLGVTKDETRIGHYIAEGRGLDRSEYKIGRADINNPIGDPITPKPPVEEPSENEIMMSEVHVSSTLTIRVDIMADADWTAKPSDPPPPDEEHTGKATIYSHKIKAELVIDGIPAHLREFLLANVKMRSPSGRTFTFSENAIFTIGQNENGSDVITIEDEWAHFINDGVTGDNPEWNPEIYCPKDYDLDYPNEIEQVDLTGFNTSNPGKSLEESQYLLFQKAPNDQQVISYSDQNLPVKSNIRPYPQRILFVPQTLLKGEASTDAPISVRVTRKSDNRILGTVALVSTSNPNYKMAVLNAISIDALNTDDLSIQLMGANAIPEQNPAPIDPTEYWVDTRPYNSIGQFPIPFDPQYDLIQDYYFSDIYVDYSSYSPNPDTHTQLGFWNWQSLPDKIREALQNLQLIVKVTGYWNDGDPSEQIEIQLIIQTVYSDGKYLYRYPIQRDACFIPSLMEIIAFNEAENYLLYKGLGTHQNYFGHLPEQVYPHHRMYAFTTKDDRVPADTVVLTKKSDSSEVSSLAIESPSVPDYFHYLVQLPDTINPSDYNFIPQAQDPAFNPVISHYASDVKVIFYANPYTFWIGPVYGGFAWFYNVRIENIHSLPDYYANLISSGQAYVEIMGTRNGSPVTHVCSYNTGFDPYTYNYYESTINYTYPLHNDHLVLSHLLIKVRDPNLGHDILIYEGMPDEVRCRSLDFQEYTQYPHNTLHAFRAASNRENIISVQAIRKADGKLVGTLPILPTYNTSYVHDYVKLPEKFTTEDGTIVLAKDCEFQPVGPAFYQPYTVQDRPVKVLGYNIPNLFVAEGFWHAQSRITSQMYWARYNEDWMDWWDGNEYRWEGQNQVQVTYHRSDDFKRGNEWGEETTYITVKYSLKSKTGNEEEVEPETFKVNGANTAHTLNLYSPHTTSPNQPAQLASIINITIEHEIDGQRLRVFDQGPIGEQYILYLGPMPSNVVNVAFEYRAIDSGKTGLWQTMLPMKIKVGNDSEQLAINFFDSNTVPVGHYEYRFNAFDSNGQLVDLTEQTNHHVGADGSVAGEFEINRYQGVVVPKSNLTEEVVRPIETAQYDRWSNVVHYEDKRKAPHDFEYDNEDRRIVEIGPEIDIEPEEEDPTLPPPTTEATDDRTGYAQLPIKLMGVFHPELKVELRQTLNHGNAVSAALIHLTLDLPNMKELPYAEYELTITWLHQQKVQYSEPFVWTSNESDAPQNDGKYKGKVTAIGYEETRQIALKRDAADTYEMPNGIPQWKLRVLVHGAWYTLLEGYLPAEYTQQENIAGELAVREAEKITLASPAIAIFSIDSFHAPKKIRYLDAEGNEKTAKVTHTHARKGQRKKYHIAELPPKTKRADLKQAQALLPANKIRIMRDLIKASPTRYHYYDEVGQYLGNGKSKNQYWARVVDGAGLPYLEYSPAALKVLTERNIFGDAVATMDAQGHATFMILNKRGQPVQVTYAYHAEEGRYYNAQGHELKFTDGNNKPRFVQPGINGHSAQERDADGYAKAIDRQAHTGQIITECFADETENITTRNFFGKDKGGTDRSGAALRKESNYAGDPTMQVSDEHGSEAEGNLVPGQSLAFSQLADGKPYQVLDQNTNVLIETRPEIGGKNARRLVITDRGVTQDMLTEYNLMGWVIKQSDIDWEVITSHDLQGNKRVLIIKSQKPGANPPEPFDDQQQIFTFNNDNQVLIARADRDTDGKLIWDDKNKNTSVAEYTQGQRTILTFYRRDKNRYVTENYHFDDGGRVDRITRNDGSATTWVLNAANLITNETTVDEFQWEESREITYTPGNRPQIITQTDPDAYSETRQDRFDADGTLLHASQEGERDGNGYSSSIDYSYVTFDKEHETKVTNAVTTELGTTVGVGNTYRDANANPVTYVDQSSTERTKTMLMGPLGEPYEVSEGAPGAEPTRISRLYPDADLNVAVEFARDPDRPELAAGGSFIAGTEARPSLETSPQKQTIIFTAPVGLTLQKLSGGNQEWEWALRQANPGISPAEDLGGKQIKLPYGESKNHLNANDKGTPANMGRLMGSSVPTAPVPYIPEQDTVGGVKNYLPAMIGAVVAIVAVNMVRVMIGVPVTSLSAGKQLAALMTMGTTGYAAGNAAAQLTAMEMFPDFLPDGFNWNSVSESALLGAIMGLTQGAAGKTTQNMTTNSPWQDTILAMEQAAVTYLTTYGFNAAAGNSTSSYDMRGLVGVMLSAGVTQTLFAKYGFSPTSKDNAPNVEGDTAWDKNTLPVLVKDTVTVLGGGFADAAMNAAFSGNPMNPEMVFAMSMGRLVARQAGYAVQALSPSSEGNPTPSVAQVKQENETMVAAKSVEQGNHQVKAPNQVPPLMMSSMGADRVMADAVEDSVTPTATPRQKTRITRQYNRMAAQRGFEEENPMYQASKQRADAPHRMPRWEEEEEYNELPVYNYPKRPAIEKSVVATPESKYGDGKEFNLDEMLKGRYQGKAPTYSDPSMIEHELMIERSKSHLSLILPHVPVEAWEYAIEGDAWNMNRELFKQVGKAGYAGYKGIQYFEQGMRVGGPVVAVGAGIYGGVMGYLDADEFLDEIYPAVSPWKNSSSTFLTQESYYLYPPNNGFMLVPDAPVPRGKFYGL